MKFRWWYLVLVATIVGAVVRFWNINALPSSLYWDEVSLGYDAYAIAQTGHDLHGQAWPFPAFYSYGDYKPAGYFYLLAPFVKIFGLEPWVVRIPSVLAGISLIAAVALLGYFLADRRESQIVAVVAAWITALSPWAIQFSRGGWEVNVATAMITWATVLWLANIHSQKWGKKIVAILLLAAAAYTYHAARVVSPIILGLLCLLEFPVLNRKIWSQWVMQCCIVVTGLIILLIPLLMQLKEPAVQKRFAETSLLSDGQAVLQSNHLREISGNTWWSKILYHRWILSAWIVAKNASLHFSPEFLFIHGDENLRHGTTATGIFYVTDAIWLVSGLFALVKIRKKNALLLVGWVFAGLLPPAITTAAPHALRFLLAMPAFIVITSIGFAFVLRYVSRQYRSLVSVGFACLLVVNFVMYWRYYTQIYAVLGAQSWQFGYADVVPLVADYRHQHRDVNVYFTREQGRPAMYYWFYAKIDPRSVQRANVNPQDQGEFLEFDHIYFINSVNEAKEGLVISSVKGYEQLQSQHRLIKDIATINDAEQKSLWKVFELQK